MDVKNSLDKINAAITNSEGKNKSYSEFVAEFLKDRVVEVYFGETYEEIKLEQVETNYPSVICGKIIGAHNECLVLNIVSVNVKGEITTEGIVFLNQINIKAIKDVDGHGALESSFISSRHSHKVLKNFISK